MLDTDALRALALVIEFRRASVAAREDLEACVDPDLNYDLTCYRAWRDTPAPGSSPFEPETNLGRRATSDEVAEWCPACQRNEERVKRRIDGRRRRGAALRKMHALAKKVGEA